MSMLATFVQVDPSVLDDPDRVESLFEPTSPMPALFDPERMREAILSRGPRLLAGAMDVHPQLREQLEQSLGRSQAALRSGEGGEQLLALMQQRFGGAVGGGGRPQGMYTVLSLDKAWHGVHYVLSGTVEPDQSLVSQAVLGGTEIGEDFAGYGPARCFTAVQVAELARALDDPALETEAAGRYDPARMAALQIYPFGWDELDNREWVFDALRDLRGFYREAAENGRAVVTCLV